MTPPTLEQIARELLEDLGGLITTHKSTSGHFLKQEAALARILTALQTATKRPEGAGDWAETAAKEIRQTHYAFNPDVQMVGPLAAIIRKHAPQ